jgi:twitching motility protein PilT
MAYQCMSPRERAIFENTLTADFSMDAKEHGRFRFNVFHQSGKVCMAIRHIPKSIPAMEDLNLPEETLKKIADTKRGLILLSGMTGSGKSSTLASMIDHINKTRRGHILTIEDPIEYVHADKKCIVSQLALEEDTPSYAAALRAALRQEPDVILVGEMRDAEVIRAAIAAAETGHLVFSTVHSANVVQTINRLVEAFPAEQHGQIRMHLSDFLKGVICQRLLPGLKGGMVPSLEIMIDTPQIKKLILDDKIFEIPRFMTEGDYYGMQTFDQSLAKLYKSGQISMEDALSNASSPDALMLTIKGISSGRDQK